MNLIGMRMKQIKEETVKEVMAYILDSRHINATNRLVTNLLQKLDTLKDVPKKGKNGTRDRKD